MSRRRAAEKRVILPDHKFKDIVLAKFMNRIMIDGKKSISEKIVYGAFDIVSKKTDKTPIDFFHEALNNVKPSLEVRSRRVGGATYQVPMEVRPKRAQTLAMKWIVDSALKRNEKTMRERVANEITTTFSSFYTAEISLEEMLDPEILKNYAKQATGQKYLVTPHK